jgi:hypothetical protein
MRFRPTGRKASLFVGVAVIAVLGFALLRWRDEARKPSPIEVPIPVTAAGPIAASSEPVPADPSCAPTTEASRLSPAASREQVAGVETDRFIDVPTRKVVHGVDVSRNADTANFTRIHTCGGSFVYVRMSYGSEPWIEDRWRPLWLRASLEGKSAGAAAGPFVRGGYHVLVFSKEIEGGRASPEWESAVRAETQRQAGDYVKRMKDVLQTGGDRAMLPVALAIFRSATVSKAAAGRLYRLGVCVWFEEVQNRLSAYRMKHVVLRAEASLFEELQLSDLTCDKVAPIKLWLAEYTTDGGEPADSKGAEFYQACVKSGRCLFHKYTARGRLTVAEGKEFVGLDRFLGDRAQFEASLIDLR